MLSKLKSKETKIGVIGLGYVGLPIALAFAEKYKTVGFDINAKRVEMMQKGIDPSQELESSEFKNKDIVFTSNPDDLKDIEFYVVAVPTPIDEHHNPNLKALFSATQIVGKNLSAGNVVVYESTVYPGCTEEDCVPILEKESGLAYIKDFKVGYSPERINPGDKEHTLKKIKKVVSGCDPESSKLVADVYGSIIEAGVFEAGSIKVAEAAKVIENTQRDLNIALMNELSLIFRKMDINTYDVLEAAGTKWNFLKFYPGLVGGHCIGVDPYYLTHKANELGYHSKVILSGRNINDSMGSIVAKEVIKLLIDKDKSLKRCNVLVLGATFKENVSDIRNSKVVDLVKELESFKINVDISDPYASPEEFEEEYGIKLSSDLREDYDAIIVAVSHKDYVNFDEDHFRKFSSDNPIVADLKGIYRNKIKNLTYYSL